MLLVSLPDHEFWPALWQPRAQGTWRPLSERLFFYYFYHWFGLDAFPYRLLVFATHVVNLMLLAAVTHRLTRQRWAGFVAASLWGLHHGLARSLTWTSAYNQILCAFFFLLSFWLFLRFVTTGRWRYYLAQWVTFILGFGAHEVMVVYPAALFAYVVLLDRRRWPHVALMFLASASLGWLQWRTVQALASGVYQPYFDAAGLVGSLLYYGRSSVAGYEPVVVALLVGTPLLAVAAHQARRKNFLGLFLSDMVLVEPHPLPVRSRASLGLLSRDSDARPRHAGWLGGCVGRTSYEGVPRYSGLVPRVVLVGLGSKGLSRGELLSTAESLGETADLRRLPSEESSPHEDDPVDECARDGLLLLDRS